MVQQNLFATQGGGLAILGDDGQFIWHEVPDWMTEAQVGDPVPEDWGLVSI